MLPKWHILIGFVFSYVLVYFLHFSILAGLVVFLWSFLIDVDHWLIYALRGKFNLTEDYNQHKKITENYLKLSIKERRKYKRYIIIFHGLEFVLVLVLLSFVNQFFFWILLGTLIHMLADFFDLHSKQEPFYSKISQIYVYITNKNKKEFY